LESLRSALSALGAKPCHAGPILRAFARGEDLRALAAAPSRAWPGSLAAGFGAFAEAVEGIARVAESHDGGDGSERLLLSLGDGRAVEAVLLPRDGLCVSTQAGCAVGCLFCLTGRDGLLRQLRSAEIVAQVALARRRRPVRRVVFMGMGEPSHNFAAVAEAIDFLGTEGGVGHKNLVFSTVGEPRLFERLLAMRVRPALALSLHTTEAEKRARLLPRAPRVLPETLLRAALDYARRTGYPLQIQWTLLEGVNDSDEEMERLASWMVPNRSIVNFIPWNRVEGLEFRRPSVERMRAIARFFHARGLLAKLRRSAGQSIDAACGQLTTQTRQGTFGGIVSRAPV